MNSSTSGEREISEPLREASERSDEDAPMKFEPIPNQKERCSMCGLELCWLDYRDLCSGCCRETHDDEPY